MAGYMIYSLDGARFREMVERPTPDQLKFLARDLAAERKALQADGAFEEDDPILKWPRKADGLAPIVAERLALPDWYGDLSQAGKGLWEGMIFAACLHEKKLGLGFRAHGDGIGWDVIEIARKHLGVAPNSIREEIAVSTFGTRPFRYESPPQPVGDRREGSRPEESRRASLGALSNMLGDLSDRIKQQKMAPANLAKELLQGLDQNPRVSREHKNALNQFLDDDADPDDAEDWSPMHSMHTPEEVQKMQEELRSAEGALKAAKEADAYQQYKDDLMPALETIAAEGRMLFVQVDA